MGFRRTEADYSVFIREKIMIKVYDDDLLFVGRSIDEMIGIKCPLKGQFMITDLG